MMTILNGLMTYLRSSFKYDDVTARSKVCSAKYQVKPKDACEKTSVNDIRLIPTAIDELARTQPEKVFASIPITTNIADGFQDITYLTYADAIDRALLWLSECLGEACHGESIGYLAPSDLRYAILTVAAAKLGCKVCANYASG